MVRKPPSSFSLFFAVGSLLAFVIWTLLVLHTSQPARLDQLADPRPLAATTAVGQVATTIAVLSWPPVVYLAVLGLALWAFRHRLRDLAGGLVLSVPIGLAALYLAKLLIRRARPDDAIALFTTAQLSYPSGHLVAMTSAVICVGATFTVTRQRRAARIQWGVGGLLLVLLVGLDRLLVAANLLSDLIGGLLLGAVAASIALLITGVTAVPTFATSHSSLARTGEHHVDSDGAVVAARRCAVVYNPTKILDWVSFRRHVEYELTSRGWTRAIWLETTADDPGVEMTARAVAEKVDLVLGAGGDGTIRVVCSGLSRTGIPFGLIPAGTGNLLARNLGIPLDESAALDVAFDGMDKPTDVVQIRVNGGAPDHFMVMAGIGIDAMIMQSTNPELKKAVGSAAYFVSAAQNANHPAAHATIQVDDQEPFKRRAHVIVIGNVGYLQANIPLIPDAKPDDGLLDVLIASPRSARDWIRITSRVLTRGSRPDDQLDRITGRKVRIEVTEPDHYQLDGDTVGDCSLLEAEVLPGALTIRVPQSARNVRPADAAAADGAVEDADDTTEDEAPQASGVRNRPNQAAASA